MATTTPGEPGVIVTDPSNESGRRRSVIGAYVALTKPRIIELLLVTTVPAMVVAAGGWPGTWLVVATLIGGTLSAGGANTLNNFVDRDIDELMKRTSRRPLPRHRVPPLNALRFGIALGLFGFFWLWAFTNVLAAAISTLALVVLRLRLHPAPEAHHPPEHRDRRSGRGGSRAGGLGSRDRLTQSGRLDPVRHRLLLDAAPLLGAGPPLQGRLRGRRHTHAAGGGERTLHRHPDDLVHGDPGRSSPSSWFRSPTSAGCT